MENVNCNNCNSENPTTSKYCSRCGYELPKIKFDNLTDILQQKKPEKKDKKKQLLGTVVGMIFFGLSYIAVQQLFFKTPSIDKVMMEAYNYTLVNIDKATADTLGMKNYIEPNVINSVKTNPQMKFQRDHNTTMNYYYKDKYGVYLFVVSVTPDKYK
jgi:hypothetical protein